MTSNKCYLAIEVLSLTYQTIEKLRDDEQDFTSLSVGFQFPIELLNVAFRNDAMMHFFQNIDVSVKVKDEYFVILVACNN